MNSYHKWETHKSTLCFLLLRTMSFCWGVHENDKFAVHHKGHALNLPELPWLGQAHVRKITFKAKVVAEWYNLAILPLYVAGPFEKATLDSLATVPRYKAEAVKAGRLGKASPGCHMPATSRGICLIPSWQLRCSVPVPSLWTNHEDEVASLCPGGSSPTQGEIV